MNGMAYMCACTVPRFVTSFVVFFFRKSHNLRELTFDFTRLISIPSFEGASLRQATVKYHRCR